MARTGRPGASAVEPEGHADLADQVDCVLRFGALMLRAGNTAFRTRHWMGAVGRAMGIDALAVHVSVGAMTATARRGGELITLASEVAPLGVNAWRIGALERLARSVSSGISAGAIGVKLNAIEAARPLHSSAIMAAAGGAACGAFSFLNGGGALEVFASLVSGGIGQALRQMLLRRQFNQYAVAAVCAVVASSAYWLVTSTIDHAGLGAPRNGAGFISSVLFLVPGFPLIAALLDLLQNQTLAGISRLAYGGMLLAGTAFGVSLVSVVAGLTAQGPAAPALSENATLLLRAIASVAGGCGFAIIFNSSWRSVLAIGGFALLGNELRLALHDAGVALAPATFLGALSVGVAAAVVRHRLHEPWIAMTLPGIIIMVPGTFVFQAVLFFSQGDVQAGLRAAVLGGFVVGAMALGLAVARLATLRTLLVDSQR